MCPVNLTHSAKKKRLSAFPAPEDFLADAPPGWADQPAGFACAGSHPAVTPPPVRVPPSLDFAMRWEATLYSA